MSRRSTKAKLTFSGKTPEGLLVVGNIYAFYETHGVPLADIMFRLWQKDSLPDWIELINDMVKAGRPMDRAILTVIGAVQDACYPHHVREYVVGRLQELAKKCEDHD